MTTREDQNTSLSKRNPLIRNILFFRRRIIIVYFRAFLFSVHQSSLFLPRLRQKGLPMVVPQFQKSTNKSHGSASCEQRWRAFASNHAHWLLRSCCVMRVETERELTMAPGFSGCRRNSVAGWAQPEAGAELGRRYGGIRSEIGADESRGGQDTESDVASAIIKLVQIRGRLLLRRRVDCRPPSPESSVFPFRFFATVFLEWHTHKHNPRQSF